MSRALPVLVITAFLALPVLYLLSTGPILGLYHRGLLGDAGWYVSNFYAPLEWLCGRSDMFTLMMVSYIHPWLPILPDATPLLSVS
jgi:hypothetical protein